MDFNTIQPLKVSSSVSKKILADSKVFIEPPTIRVLLKYAVLFIFSIFISLVICPQNGVGLLRENFPIYHHIFHNNLLVCGLYCGAVFFITTHLVSIYILNHYERVLILNNLGYIPIILMSTFFAFSMTPYFSITEFSMLYTIGWLGVALFSYSLHRKIFLTKINLNSQYDGL